MSKYLRFRWSILFFLCVALIFVKGYGGDVLAAPSLSELNSGAAHKVGDIAARIEAVRLQLNQWSGQTEILNGAQKEIEQVLNVAPSNVHALKELARIQIMRGYMHSTVEKNLVHDKYSVGIFKKGSLEGAEKTIRKALSIDPDFADGYVLLGSIQNDELKYKEAEKSLTKAGKLGSTSPWLDLEWTYNDDAVGNYADKEIRYQAAIKSGTENLKALGSAYAGLLSIYQSRGEVDKTISMYKKIIALKPMDAWTRGDFASYLGGDLDRTDDAITQARAALKIMDYGVGAQILAIQLARKWAELSDKGQSRIANIYYDEAIKKFPWINAIMVYGGSEPVGDVLAKELVKQGKVSVNVTIKDGSTALLYAAYFDNRKAANELLDLHADPNISDNSGLTSLMSAAQKGDIILAQMLLKHGANSNALMQGWKAADFAARRGDKKLESLLRNAETGKPS